jgi:hypothetical protein
VLDDLGRVNLTPHLLDRRAREEPYHGRHGRRQRHEDDPAGRSTEPAEDEADEPAAGSHVDLRI